MTECDSVKQAGHQFLYSEGEHDTAEDASQNQLDGAVRDLVAEQSEEADCGHHQSQTAERRKIGEVPILHQSIVDLLGQGTEAFHKRVAWACHDAANGGGIQFRAACLDEQSRIT